MEKLPPSAQGLETGPLSQVPKRENPNREGAYPPLLRFRLTLGPIIPGAIQGVWVTEG